jgi:hypothetical protein
MLMGSGVKEFNILGGLQLPNVYDNKGKYSKALEWN